MITYLLNLFRKGKPMATVDITNIDWIKTAEDYRAFCDAIPPELKNDKETQNRAYKAFSRLQDTERLRHEREKVAAVFAKATPRLEPDPVHSYKRGRTEHLSPSGKYRLVVTPYETGPSSWDYTLGKVYRVSDGAKLFEIRRNYGRFWHAFVEGHPNGHDYLLCGENYQRYNILELDTGKRFDLPPGGMDGWGAGFCFINVLPSPNKTMLAVVGCVWGGPYDVHIYDFEDPLAGPLLCLAEIYAVGSDDNERWDEDNVFHCTGEHHVRKSDGKDWDSLLEDEQDEAESNGDEDYTSKDVRWERAPRLTYALKTIDSLVRSESYYKGEIKPYYRLKLARTTARLTADELAQVRDYYLEHSTYKQELPLGNA